jgi:Tetratricopeptide repeat
MGVDEPPPAEARVIEGGAPSNREAQRLHAEGLAKLRVLDALAACELLQKAVAADSSSPMVHLALADAWTMLGYDTKAREEALRASDLSGRLPREERLAIEGRYREMAGEWDRAVEIYGALLAFFPDSVEYGLRLANAQDTGGRGDEALATLERLRRLPAPESQDARLDLAEAAVAHSRGDFRRQLLAARASGGQGRRAGGAAPRGPGAAAGGVRSRPVGRSAQGGGSGRGGPSDLRGSGRPGRPRVRVERNRGHGLGSRRAREGPHEVGGGPRHSPPER